MCDPITIGETTITMGELFAGAGVALTAGSTAFSLKSQSDQAGNTADYEAQVSAQNAATMQQNRVLAARGFNDQTYQEARNLIQSRQAVAQQGFNEAIQAKQARGQVLTAAASGGVEGVSLQNLLDDFHRQEAMFNNALNTNLQYKEEQTRADYKGLQAQYSGRIAGLMPYVPQPIQQPNYLGGIFNFGAASLNAYTNSLKIQNPSTTNGTGQPADNGNGAGSTAFNRTVSQPDHSGGYEF